MVCYPVFVMNDIFNYKDEAAEVIQKWYRPATKDDKEYVPKSLAQLYVEICEVIPEGNFKDYELYEVLKSLNFEKFLGANGFEYRVILLTDK